MAQRSDTIKQMGEKWVLYSKRTGKKISEHGTEEEAKRQETAINMAKARAAGHRLPAPPKKTDIKDDPGDPADVPCCVELISTGLWAVIAADGEKLSEHASEMEAMQAVAELHRPSSANTDSHERVFHLDTVSDAELAPPKRMENGFLFANARLTRTGVFTYRNKDGTKRRELRLPEEVFHADAVASFDQVPVTDEHPPAFLTAANAKEFSRGSLGGLRRDGKWLVGSVMVTDADLVEKMERGDARQMSLGYTCELEWKSGEYEGEKFDCIQRRIEGNHGAVVDKARAGPEARVRMDSADDTVISVDSPTRGDTVSTPNKVKVGDVEYEEGSASHLQALAAQQKRADSEREAAEQRAKAADEKASKAQAEADKAKARADAAEETAKKAEQLAKDAPAKAAEQIRARMKLEDDARAVLGRDAKLDGLDDGQIIEKTLKHAQPELKLDGKSADYRMARFELAVEQAREDAEDDPDREDAKDNAAARARAGEGGNLDADDPPPRTNTGRGRHVRGDATEADYKAHEDKDDAYDAMVRRSRSAWKQPLSDNKPAF